LSHHKDGSTQVQDDVGVTQGKKRGWPVGSKDKASRKKKPWSGFPVMEMGFQVI
jgi:hypothetical protein